VKKTDTQIKTPTKQRWTIPKNPTKSKEPPERGNPTSNWWEFHRDVTRHGQPKCTGALKKFQDNKNKEHEKTQKQVNEIIEDLKKHQTETETTINREINELRAKFDNIKEEVTYNIENLRKKEWNRNTENGKPLQQNRTKQKTESQNLKMKWQLKEKLKNY
jgi:uncharacterized protein YbbC (DUF1343 family)